MIIDPKIIIEQKFLRPCEHTKIQQSGIDITLQAISRLTSASSKEQVEANEFDYFDLQPGVYDFVCNEFVFVPHNCAALVIVRSSYNRKGAFITTGLYDNGFKNYIGGILRVEFPLTIPKNERIAQIIFMQSDGKQLYNGQYQSKELNESLS